MVAQHLTDAEIRTSVALNAEPPKKSLWPHRWLRPEYKTRRANPETSLLFRLSLSTINYQLQHKAEPKTMANASNR